MSWSSVLRLSVLAYRGQPCMCEGGVDGPSFVSGGPGAFHLMFDSPCSGAFVFSLFLSLSLFSPLTLIRIAGFIVYNICIYVYNYVYIDIHIHGAYPWRIPIKVNRRTKPQTFIYNIYIYILSIYPEALPRNSRNRALRGWQSRSLV